MNKLGCLIIMFITCRVCEGQNLVPNGDFEQYSGCPSLLGQLDLAIPWINPATNITGVSGTSDYYNQCSTSTYSDVPNNYLGYQQAHSGGGYSGILLCDLSVNSYREYIETPLTSPLIANTCYHFEMSANLGNNSRFTTDAVGVYFSNSQISGINNWLPLPFNPQINNISGNNFDSLNWTLVSGNYNAQGGESYLIIGNFKYDSQTTFILVNSTILVTESYIYIDDVSLTPCTTGINENEKNASVNIFPSPFSDKVNITTSRNEPVEFVLYDVTGRKTFQQSFTNSTSINTGQLAKGIYLYEVRNKNEVIKKGKVVKE